MNEKIFTPLIIIGAPRSGTNMLRDVLCKLPGFETWPCDEINYIWRHGNVKYPSDAIPSELATPAVVSYIRDQFDDFRKGKEINFLVEKTCANSLRIPFVDAVVPEAKYIYIVRNGIDVVSSARKRWTADLDFQYILKKVKYVPVTDLPYYAIRYLWHRLYRLVSKDNRLASWGPVLNNMDTLLAQFTCLEELCAMQWNECVRLSDQAFSQMDASKVHRVKYECFVQNPCIELKRIGVFLGLSEGNIDYEHAVADVRVSSVGKGKKDINNDLYQMITPIMKQTLIHHGY